MRCLLAVTLVASLVAGCAGMNAAQRTKDLRVGMTTAEVVKTLGQEPESSSAQDGKTVLRFSLHENWKGFVPWYMTFDKDGRLEAWRADEAEWKRNQDAAAKEWGLDTPGAGAQAQPDASRAAIAPAAAPAGPNNPDLQRYFAGRYMSYSGSTHRVFIISASGRFLYTTESSYSGLQGQVGGVWGAASQSGDGGTWTIEGDRTQGRIHLRYNGGRQETVNYRVGSERGVLILNGATFAFEAAAD